MKRNRGMVAVGTSADTGQFATDSIRHWWQHEERPGLPQGQAIAHHLLTAAAATATTPDCSKPSLQLQFANDSELSLTVCHYPRRRLSNGIRWSTGSSSQIQHQLGRRSRYGP